MIRCFILYNIAQRLCCSNGSFRRTAFPCWWQFPPAGRCDCCVLVQHWGAQRAIRSVQPRAQIATFGFIWIIYSCWCVSRREFSGMTMNDPFHSYFHDNPSKPPASHPATLRVFRTSKLMVGEIIADGSPSLDAHRRMKRIDSSVSCDSIFGLNNTFIFAMFIAIRDSCVSACVHMHIYIYILYILYIYIHSSGKVINHFGLHSLPTQGLISIPSIETVLGSAMELPEVRWRWQDLLWGKT